MWQFQWNSATRERRDLADLLTVAGESLLVIVRLPDDPVPATVRLSSLKGPADPARREPHHLRTILGYGNFLLNYVHAADEPADLVRELGILFGAERRRAVYDALIRGADASDVARRHAADLYAEIPAVDVTLDTTLANVRRQLAERNGHGEPSAPSDWRELSRRARDAGAPLALREELVIGTHLMEHTEPGLSQILGGVSVDDWGGRS